MTDPGPMERALGQARAAASRNEVPVGAVLVGPDGEIIAEDGNRTIELKDPTAHAEILVLRSACQRLKSERLVGSDLYVTLEPCTMCAAAISFSRIRRLYFGAFDPKAGAVENGIRFYAQTSCHYSPEVYGGIDEVRAGELLRAFFKARRV